jgi:hypothetical protein
MPWTCMTTIPSGKHSQELRVCEWFAAGTTYNSHLQSVKRMVYELHAGPLGVEGALRDSGCC